MSFHRVDSYRIYLLGFQVPSETTGPSSTQANACVNHKAQKMSFLRKDIPKSGRVGIQDRSNDIREREYT